MKTTQTALLALATAALAAAAGAAAGRESQLTYSGSLHYASGDYTLSETGLGDPVFRADFAVSERQASGVRFGVYGAAKPPLADEDSGFGTGAWDYGVGITVSKRAGSVLLLADLGHWIFGDLPDFELKDPFTYGFGLGRSLEGGRYSVLGSISGYTEIVDGVDGPAEAGLTVSRLDSSGRSFNLTLSAGLTESAPDYSL